MSTFQSTASPQAEPQQPKRKDYRNAIYAVLTAALLGTWGYMLYFKNKSTGENQQVLITANNSDSARSAIQSQFDASIARLDSLSGVNNAISGQLKDRNAEIANLKSEIRNILNKKNATQAELDRARTLIADLQGKVEGLVQEVERLKGENQQLAVANTELTGERDIARRDRDSVARVAAEQGKTIEVGSTLNAFNITITPINEKRGGKEKATTSAKRVDKLVIDFDVENRIAKSGTTDIYVTITGPDGKIVNSENQSGGSITLRSGDQKTYSYKESVEYSQGERKHIKVSCKQPDFQRGNYKIEIFQNGNSIGGGVRELKKGGLFG